MTNDSYFTNFNVKTLMVYTCMVQWYCQTLILVHYASDGTSQILKQCFILSGHCIIVPHLNDKWLFFSTVLVNIVPIVDFISGLCSNTFDTIIKDPEHRLNRLIQFSGPSRYALRCNRRFIVPKCKTDRFRNSFRIRSCIDNIYT